MDLDAGEDLHLVAYRLALLQPGITSKRSRPAKSSPQGSQAATGVERSEGDPNSGYGTRVVKNTMT